MGGSIEENLEETRAKKMIDLCRKCFNSYVKVKKKLEVSDQSFNIAIYLYLATSLQVIHQNLSKALDACKIMIIPHT